jgi:hypothetical protein
VFRAQGAVLSTNSVPGSIVAFIINRICHREGESLLDLLRKEASWRGRWRIHLVLRMEVNSIGSHEGKSSRIREWHRQRSGGRKAKKPVEETERSSELKCKWHKAGKWAQARWPCGLYPIGKGEP